MRIEEFKLERFFAKHEADAKYMLGASDCESFAIKELLTARELSELQSLRLGYSESQGNTLLRKEIAKQFQNVNYKEIVIAAPQEGIFIALNSLLSSGDKAVIQVPCYQSLCAIPKSIGCEVETWSPTPQATQWSYNLDELKEKVDKKTKLIVINSPQNPTGHQFSKKEYAKIIRIAKENNCYLFSDEMYRTLEFDEEDRLPIGSDIYKKCVSLSGVSKTLGLGGLRIGWLSIKEAPLLHKILKLKDYTTLSNSILSEFVALAALRKKEQITGRNLEIIRNNLKTLEDFFKRHRNQFKWISPKAGTVAFVQLIFNKNIEEFCEELINEKGVLLMPGTKFGYKHYFRLGYGRKNLPQALRLLEEFLNENIEGKMQNRIPKIKKSELLINCDKT